MDISPDDSKVTPAQPTRWRLLFDDALLITIMALLAGCGLIYEYLLSHYAGRILGAVESAIYTMIGLMIVAMGLGAFAARWFKSSASAFAWLEVIIAFVGMLSTLFIAGFIALSSYLPALLTSIYNVPIDVQVAGESLIHLQQFARLLPYIVGFILGFLIGMEIPLIARVREHVYGQHLINNTGTIYGADYIGAGIGAAVWVSLMLSMDIAEASAWTASVNLLAGGAFLWRFRHHIRYVKALVLLHLVALSILGVLFVNGASWMQDLAKALYKDNVVFQQQTKYQHLALTERYIAADKPAVIDLYLNGRLQFSSADEQIYHAMLVHPAMAISARTDNVLIIGGGDGMALREVLRWSPEQVTLVDLDPDLVALFKNGSGVPQDSALKQSLIELNRAAFDDPRVTLLFNDAFLQVETFIQQQQHFDTIIIDLPDPSHPDLNKLYSVYFYSKIKQILSADGVMVVQSTSPFHAKSAFMSIGKTIAESGFGGVNQYRQNVPSFGEWGWTIATKQGAAPKARIEKLSVLSNALPWVTRSLLLASFEFPKNYYSTLPEIEINYLGSGVLYQYHYNAWAKQEGVFIQNQ